MKSLSMGLLHLTLLLALIACGKENESGKKNSSGYWNSQYGVPNVNSPYNYSGMSVNQVIQQNPCKGGMGGVIPYGYNNQPYYNNQRFQTQIPLTGFPTVISPGDVYVGVTSYGDVGVIAGTAAGQPPVFVGYMCPRSFIPNGAQMAITSNINIGAYSQCLFKSIIQLDVGLHGVGTVAAFRWLDGGTSAGQKFTFCR